MKLIGTECDTVIDWPITKDQNNPQFRGVRIFCTKCNAVEDYLTIKVRHFLEDTT